MQCFRPIRVRTSPYPVPCGKCPACLANRRQEWVSRLKAELAASAFGLFCTFTYDDDHLPHNAHLVDQETGEIIDLPTFYKRDLQLFLKRLRKKCSLRYFIVGEFGDNTHRPHYHGLLFFTKETKKDAALFDTITQAWRNGFVKYGDVEPASIAYCTKYCMKLGFTPFQDSDELFQHDDLTKKDKKEFMKNFRPFILCSRRPYIGHQLEDKVEMHFTRGEFGGMFQEGTFVRSPRIVKDKVFAKVPALVKTVAEEISEERSEKQLREDIRMAKRRGHKFLATQKKLKEQRMLAHIKKQTL